MAALETSGFGWRVVARTGRRVVRSRWRVRASPIPRLDGHMNIQGVDIFVLSLAFAFAFVSVLRCVGLGEYYWCLCTLDERCSASYVID